MKEFEDLAGFQSPGLLTGLEEFLNFVYIPQVALRLQILLWLSRLKLFCYLSVIYPKKGKDQLPSTCNVLWKGSYDRY